MFNIIILLNLNSSGVHKTVKRGIQKENNIMIQILQTNYVCKNIFVHWIQSILLRLCFGRIKRKK